MSEIRVGVLRTIASHHTASNFCYSNLYFKIESSDIVLESSFMDTELWKCIVYV